MLEKHKGQSRMDNLKKL